MRLNKRTVQKVLKGALAAAPAIPYLTRSRARTSVAAYVIGGLSLALAGGIFALMYFSPRTRTRALGVAKDTYGKVNAKIGQLRHHEPRYGTSEVSPMSNGLVGEYNATSGL
jgi:hypothetical protein